MKKYRSVFDISLAQEFAYRANFIMWRVRNVVQILIIYFLWDTVFANQQNLFGYDRQKILAYIFGVLILRSIVTSVRSVDVPGEISRGDLVNYLIKPVNYFKYWFTRDLSSKALNLAFAAVEGTLLYLLLRPQIFFQSNIALLFLFLISVIFAVMIYFLLLMFFATLTFWMVEQAWGLTFLLLVFTDLLGGIVFPIDILPQAVQQIIYTLPFPYLIFFPLQIYLGKLDIATSLRVVGIAGIWIAVLGFALSKVWHRGLLQFRGEGR